MPAMIRRLTALGLLVIAGTAAAMPSTNAAPLVGAFAYDQRLHDLASDDPDPLPIETSEDLQWMIHDSRQRVRSAGPETLEQRIGATAPFRLARKLGADEVVVPVWTLHFPR